MLEHKPTVAPVPSGPLATAKHRRWRSIIVVLLVGLVNLALLTVIGFQLVTPAQHQVQSSPLVDRPAPDFTLASLSQAPAVHLAQWRGHVVMINFWASWCEPCKHEAPLLQATWQQMKNQGIIFLGVDYGDTQQNGLAFLQHYGITYPNVSDALGATSIDYGVSAVPETFFLDRQGIIVKKVTGELTKDALVSALQSLEHQP